MLPQRSEIIIKAEDLACNGYGVAWHPLHKKYWPFEINGESINWWHDAEGCASTSFINAILMTHGEMLTMVKVAKSGLGSAALEKYYRDEHKIF